MKRHWIALAVGMLLTLSAQAQKKANPYQVAIEELKKKLPQVYCPSNLIILPKYELKFHTEGNLLVFEKFLYKNDGRVDDVLVQKLTCDNITSITVDKSALQQKHGNIIVTINTVPDGIQYGYDLKKVNMKTNTMVIDICRSVRMTEANDIINYLYQLKNCGNP